MIYGLDIEIIMVCLYIDIYIYTFVININELNIITYTLGTDGIQWWKDYVNKLLVYSATNGDWGSMLLGKLSSGEHYYNEQAGIRVEAGAITTSGEMQVSICKVSSALERCNTNPTTTPDLCSNVDCGNNGNCVNGNCVCMNGFTGKYILYFDNETFN